MEFIACNTANYRAGRTQSVQYIVMHYTANNGDTARNNCDYYHRVDGSSPEKGDGLRSRKQAMLFPLHEWLRPDWNNRLPSAFAAGCISERQG